MQIIFWAALSLIAYTYFFYPVLLFLIAAAVQLKSDVLFLWRGKERRRPAEESQLPTVSLLIAAHNEEKVIEAKIKNCLELEYPREKVQFIVASDGSTDSTNMIVERYQSFGIKLVSYQERSGKLAVLNQTVPLASGEVLAFSDANTIWEPDALKKLAGHFLDENIGAVCGQLIFLSEKGTTSGENIYWLYENILKWLEGQLGTLVGATGGIYAIRKDLFQAVPSQYLADDLLIPMKALEKGYKVIYEPEAKAMEQIDTEVSSVFRRRIRVASAGYQALAVLRGFLNPAKGLPALCFWSRKVIRWSVPFLLMATLVSNLALMGQGTFFLAVFLLQITFYLGGALSHAGVIKKGPFSWAEYFMWMNIALLLGFFRCVRGYCKGTWTSPQR